MSAKKQGSQNKERGEESVPESSSNNERRTKRPKIEVKNALHGPFGLVWHAYSETLYIMNSPEIKGNTKIASFDLDGTLIVPKSQSKYPSVRSDWKWLFPEVKTKLQQLHNEGWKIVIFSNQAGVEKGHENLNHITGKIIDLASELGFPFQAFIACAIDIFRKPHTTMWEIMVQKYNDNIIPDLESCIFVGDAAGRPKNWKVGAKKDISCCDRAFAANVGIKFATPEAYFLGEKEHEVYEWDGIDPVKVLQQIQEKNIEEKDYASSSQEMVLLVGQPSSGKTTFAKRYFVSKSYVHVNRDTLGTMAKCLKFAEQAIKEGRSVVVDNTNPNAAARAPFIKIAGQVPVRCFVLNTPRELAEHLNFFRECESEGQVRRIPDVAFNRYWSVFEEPKKEEGFKEIVTIEWIPKFENSKLEQLFKQRS